MVAFLVVAATVGIVAIILVVTLLRGWALSILWGWFVVPIFGLPPLSVVQAIAIALMASMLTHQYVPPKEKDTWGPWAQAFLGPLLALGMGWIVKQYI